MTTQQQRDERTPLSTGMTTDNPIFRATQATVGMYKTVAGYKLADIPAGAELRLYGCEQTPHSSAYLYNGLNVVVPNEDMLHVEGALGTEYGEAYTELLDAYREA